VTTVSETYAKEIQMPFYGEGLDGLMRARQNALRGIVNGIDYKEFDPETDSLIEQTLRCKDLPQGKGEEQEGSSGAARSEPGR
jgi:starch synthase